MNIDDILLELGKQMGLGSLKLDENRVCRLVFDSVLVVDIEATEGDQIVNLYATVCTTPAEGKDALYETLLEASLFGLGTGGASFGIDKERGELLLWRVLNMDKTDYQEFVNVLESFVNHLEVWKDKIDKGEIAALSEKSGAKGGHEEMGHGFLKA